MRLVIFNVVIFFLFSKKMINSQGEVSIKITHRLYLQKYMYSLKSGPNLTEVRKFFTGSDSTQPFQKQNKLVDN